MPAAEVLRGPDSVTYADMRKTKRNQQKNKKKDGSFKSTIGQIYQTFDGNDLYPSVEEKAAIKYVPVVVQINRIFAT